MAKRIFLALLVTLNVITIIILTHQLAFSNEPYQEAMDLVGDYNEYQRRWMNEAWEYSNDKEFMYMLKAENGLLNHDRQSDVYKNGIRENSWGFCQTHFPSHPDLASNPLFFSDPMWQIEQCYQMWKDGTTFYAYDNIMKRNKAKKHFIFF